MAEDRGWMRIAEPPHGRISSKQEEAIREYAAGLGYETLRGFWKKLEQWGWDYYDVLHEVSP